MASTYSTSLQLQLIATGEQSGIWGTNTNINWNLIEQAVAGVQTITMSNADYTLTVLNGTADEARNMVLFVGGTNGAVRQIIAPLVPKIYIVYNNTSGGSGNNGAKDIILQPIGGSVLVSNYRYSPRALVDISAVGGSSSVCMGISRGGDAGTMVNFYSTNSSTTVIGSIGNSGNTNTTYNTSSDYRLKDNVLPMTGALERVVALKPVTWKWKSTGADGQGFIAHELAEVCPDAVTGTKDEVDAENNPVYQGVDTSYLVATLTAALQELKTINDQQAQTITALTARIEALENK